MCGCIRLGSTGWPQIAHFTVTVESATGWGSRGSACGFPRLPRCLACFWFLPEFRKLFIINFAAADLNCRDHEIRGLYRFSLPMCCVEMSDSAFSNRFRGTRPVIATNGRG